MTVGLIFSCEAVEFVSFDFCLSLRDATRDDRGPDAADNEHDEREAGELRSRPHDRRIHALLGDADAGGSPLRAIHEDGDGEVEL